MTVLAAIAAALVVVLRGPTSSAGARLECLHGRKRERTDDPRSPMRMLLCAATLVVATAVFGSALGLVIGGAAATIIAVVKPRAARPSVVVDDVPVVVDLVAGCIDAGVSIADALVAASQVATGELSTLCRRSAESLRSGALAAEAWQAWLDEPSLAPVARSLVRTARSGAPVADDLRRTAARLRARRRAARERKVQQASVWLVIPLGVCFLPAFVLVAVVPIVLGLLPTLHG